MAKALYRKYRSKTWDEVIGQEHITTTLKNSIESGKISHAYLLSGPKGVGKTSVARILAREVNKLKYDDELHLDIIEIDAASNRRIDEIRDLRDKVHIAPTSARYKVYIIDEVHMLTKEAFNALLKTLEEPPEHCIFILATTEIHKLPETIISRTQRFSFNPVSTAEVADHLKHIAGKENLKISDSALSMIARHGEGSFRDSISLLDQLQGYGKPITDKEVGELLGLPPEELVDSLSQAILSQDSLKTVHNLDELRLAGFSPILIADRLSVILRNELINRTPNAGAQLLSLLRDLLEVARSAQPQQYLELACLGYAIGNGEQRPEVNPQKTEPIEPDAKPAADNLKSETAKPRQPDINRDKSVNKFTTDDWPKILSDVKVLSPSLYTVLRLANAELKDDHLVLIFAFSLHYNKASTAVNKQLLKQCIANKFSIDGLKIKYQVDKSAHAAKQPAVNELVQDITKPAEPKASQIDTISNIFGGGEVLES